MIIFTVPGRPQGKARPRFTRAGHAYTPKATHDYEKAIREAFIATGEEMLDCPVHVLISAIFAPPKSISKKKREAMLAGEILPTIRPDTDNVAKAVLDALNGYAYHDDKQVTSLSVFKTYGLDEGITIIIKEDKG
jgi:Holliday junction resolvase RusA-like endonuclease